jgi:hypothetical protein
VPQRPPPRGLGDQANRAAEPNCVLALLTPGPTPAVSVSRGLAQLADRALRLTLLRAQPVAVALACEEVPAAERTERHCLAIVGPYPDGPLAKTASAAYSGA